METTSPSASPAGGGGGRLAWFFKVSTGVDISLEGPSDLVESSSHQIMGFVISARQGLYESKVLP